MIWRSNLRPRNAGVNQLVFVEGPCHRATWHPGCPDTSGTRHPVQREGPFSTNVSASPVSLRVRTGRPPVALRIVASGPTGVRRLRTSWRVTTRQSGPFPPAVHAAGAFNGTGAINSKFRSLSAANAGELGEAQQSAKSGRSCGTKLPPATDRKRSIGASSSPSTGITPDNTIHI